MGGQLPPRADKAGKRFHCWRTEKSRLPLHQVRVAGWLQWDRNPGSEDSPLGCCSCPGWGVLGQRSCWGMGATRLLCRVLLSRWSLWRLASWTEGWQSHVPRTLVASIVQVNEAKAPPRVESRVQLRAHLSTQGSAAPGFLGRGPGPGSSALRPRGGCGQGARPAASPACFPRGTNGGSMGCRPPAQRRDSSVCSRAEAESSGLRGGWGFMGFRGWAEPARDTKPGE
jgi:hypothetical protein